MLDQLVTAVKPRLRGWLHTGMTPLAFLGGLVLMIATPTVGGRLAVAVYVVSSLMLFGNSAVYHRGTWSERTTRLLRRFDHANIFVFIAGTYTPLAVQLLDGSSRVLLLALVWAAAALGVAFRVLWLAAPRWLYTALYLLMGWAAVGWLPQFWTNGGPVVVLLIIAGGLVYSVGAIVYARKRPNPSPTWFGFHEIFHAATVLAALCHFAAIWVATFS
ncbi:hemolysin III family protein [Tessaracoccus sp. SD287]|uniref:PAQR family membrane homeostasis protein TrhA n=1 Tax=Tessaracoccus sp. SD287 TaxID=2782008 RepID=UPI001A9778B2|nr:hemolysin III family protein [Tessaracoccus sp. SD287]MBO1030946.1 hemolysin III family protein [Tessaracoccus sp. SD287]